MVLLAGWRTAALALSSTSLLAPCSHSSTNDLEKRYKTQLQQVEAELEVIPYQASWDPVDGIVVYKC